MLLSYIDPGIISLAVQAVFVTVFGGLAAYALGPWRYMKSLFRSGDLETDSEAPSTATSSSEDES